MSEIGLERGGNCAGNLPQAGVASTFPAGLLRLVIGQQGPVLPEAMEDGSDRRRHGGYDPAPVGRNRPPCLLFTCGKLHELAGGAVVIDNADTVGREGMQHGRLQFKQGPVLPDGIAPAQAKYPRGLA